MLTVLIIFMSIIVVICGWLWIWWSRERHSQDPRAWPVIGAQLEAMANFHRIHDWCTSYFKDNHRTVKLKMLTGTIYLTVDPANLEYILKTNFQNYPKGERVHSYLHDLLGHGIFNSDGAIWKKHRKIASFEFSNRKLREFSTSTYRENAVRLLQLIHRHLHLHRTQVPPLDLQDLFMRMTMDSICKVGFGVDMGSLSPSLPKVPFGEAFDLANEAIASRLVNPLWKVHKALGIGTEKKLSDGIQTLNKFTLEIIKRRKLEIEANKVLGKHNEARNDLLSRFIGFNEGQEGSYKDEELRDSIMNFMLAGRDTTAITLSWFIYCICMNPDIGEKIHKETLEVLGLHEHDNLSFEEVAERITYESLNKMQYLHAALTETLRLYPAVPRDGKTVLSDDILPDGTIVKKGQQVSYVPYAMGRMDFLWGKDTLVFNPNRWLKQGEFQAESPFKFSAFQAGPRICLGKDSAYLQMKVAASLLLHFFKFSLVSGHEVHYRVTMVMPMSNGLLVNISHR